MKMIYLRATLSTLFFALALVSITACFIDRFHWLYLLGIPLGFAMSHYLWPKKKLGKRGFGGALYDVFEAVIELPWELFFLVMRFFSKIAQMIVGYFK